MKIFDFLTLSKNFDQISSLKSVSVVTSIEHMIKSKNLNALWVVILIVLKSAEAGDETVCTEQNQPQFVP